MPGLTAWYGLHDIGRFKKGQTIFVSAAAGAVGQMVVNLAHRAGLKVIASAGSDDKVDFIKNELGAEVVFNYKKQDTAEVLAKHEFHGFWDNVGGETLIAVLDAIQPRGVLIECGQISAYNGAGTREYYFSCLEVVAYRFISAAIPNTFQVVGKQLRMEGFIILQSATPQVLKEFYEFVPSAIASGELKQPKEHIYKGLDNGEAFVELLTGGNFGKAAISFE